jgi:hypothetical protein
MHNWYLKELEVPRRSSGVSGLETEGAGLLLEARNHQDKQTISFSEYAPCLHETTSLWMHGWVLLRNKSL